MRVLLAEDEPRVARRRRPRPAARGRGRRRRARRRDARSTRRASTPTTSSCSTATCRGCTATTSAASLNREQPDTKVLMLTAARGTRRRRRRASRSAPTTTCPSRSASPSSSRACRRSPGATASPARPCCSAATSSSTRRGARATRDGRDLELAPKEFGVLEALLAADGAVVSPEELLAARLGRARRPVHEHRPHGRDDAAPQARRPAGHPHRPGRRLPRVRPRPTVRLRLTAAYAGAGRGHDGRAAGRELLAHARASCTARCPPTRPARSRAACSPQYGIALAGTALLAIAIGWLVAGRVLSPLRRMSDTARRVSRGAPRRAHRADRPARRAARARRHARRDARPPRGGGRRPAPLRGQREPRAAQPR